MIEGQAHGSSGRFRARMLVLDRSSVLLRGEKCLDLKCLLVLLAHAPASPPARLYGVTLSRVIRKGLARAHTGHVNAPQSPHFAMLHSHLKSVFGADGLVTAPGERDRAACSATSDQHGYCH